MNRPSQPLPSPADMVPDPGPGGLRGVSITGAGITPRLDTEAFLAPAKGQAAIGRGLQEGGTALTQLALKQMEAVAIRQEAEADNVMDAAEMDIALDMAKEPDELKWGGIASKHIDLAKSRIADIPLRKITADSVDSKLRRWAHHRSRQVGIKSAERSTARAGQALDDKIDLAILNGDRHALEANITARRAFGSSNDAADELTRLKFDKVQERKAAEEKIKARTATRERFDTALLEDPWAARDSLAQGYFPDFDAADLLNAKADAERAIAAKQRGGIQEARDSIVSGFAGDHEVEVIGAQYRLGAEDIADLKEFRQKLIDAKAAAGPLDRKAVAELFGEISKYAGNERTDPLAAQWGALVQRAEVLSAAGGKEGDLTRGALMQSLYQRHPFQESKGDKDMPEGLEKKFVATIEALAADAGFGVENYRVAKAVKPDASGKLVDDGYKLEANPNAKRRQVQVQTDLWQQLKADYTANPDKWADPGYLDEWLFGKDGKSGKLAGFRAGAQVEKMRSESAGPSTELLPPNLLELESLLK